MRGLVAATLAAALLGACAGPAEDTSPPGAGPPTGGGEGVTVTLDASPAPARAGQPVTFKLVAAAAGEVTLSYRTGQRYDFEVLDASGAEVWRWSDGHSFTQVLGERSLAAGERLTYEESWTPEKAGSYRVRGTITADRPDLVAEKALEVTG